MVTYVLNKSGSPDSAAANYAHSGNGRAAILVSDRKLKAGDYGELSCPVSVVSGPAKPWLGFSRTAAYSRLPAGYLFLQILLDDRVAWEQDVATFETGHWKQERIDVGDLLAARQHATLRIRATLKRDAGSLVVTVGLDDLVPEGFTLADPGFERPASWTPAQTGPAFMPMVQVFDPQRPIRMFAAVRDLYGAAR